jgi:cobaltochelatase CobS
MELAERRSLSQLERGLLRQAVSRHPDWNSWRQSVFDPDGKPVNTSTISVNQLYDAAALFGIDVESTISAAGNADRSERRQRATPIVANNGNMAAAHASNDASQLAAVLQSILSKPQIDETAVRAIVDECLADSQPSIDESTIQGMIARALEAASIRAINLTRPDSSTVKMEGHFHPSFPELLELVKDGENVWVSGPTGSGKTHAARQVSEALSLSFGRRIPFYLQGAMSQPHEFLGFILPGNGGYVSTPFRQAFEFGGVVLFDECDASDPSVTLAMNAALANGHGVFPDRPEGVAKHPDCFIIAAANTWGSGATAEFVGRNRLDAAFMSRFPVKLPWAYDDAFELALYPGEFTKMVQSARRKAAERGLHIVIDPRHSKAGSKLVARGVSLERAAELTYLASLTEDERAELA